MDTAKLALCSVFQKNVQGTLKTPSYWYIHDLPRSIGVINDLLSNDENRSDAGVEAINRRTSFFGKRNIAADATMLFGTSFAGWMSSMSGKFIQSLESLGIPKGFGIMADGSKFRIAATTMNEQVAMKEAMSGAPGARPIIGAGTPEPLTDPRLSGLDITKYQYNHKITDANGKVLENTTIHYLQNNKTGVRFDYKFTNP